MLHRLGVFLDADTAVTLPDDSDVPDDDAWQAMRTELTRRINASPYPSLLINRLAAADVRSAESAKLRSRLILGAPRVLRVIRAELRKAFDLDPDNLLLTEPKPPAAAQKVESLTDRTLRLLVLPSVPINLNHYTTLSLKDDPARVLPFTPLEACQRVIALNLFGRLAQAYSDYWQALVPGSWLTRQERWGELHQQAFADQAFVAWQLDELSAAGRAMVQALVDAPTAQARQRAGEPWASLQVRQLMWPGVGPRLMPIPGALHIYRADDPAQSPHVMYLPGLPRNYYEYPSLSQLQCGLMALVNSALLDDLWQCLPLRRRHEVCPAQMTAAAQWQGSALRGDVFVLSAQAVLESQWENELACAVSINLAQVFSAARQPLGTDAGRFLAYIERGRKHWVGRPRLGSIRQPLQAWDQHRRRHEIIFASTAPWLAMDTALYQVKRYEKGLMRLLNPQDPLDDTQAMRDFVTLEAQLKATADTLCALLQGAQLQLFDVAFWKAKPSGERHRLASVIQLWTDWLRGEIELQHRLKLVRTAHRDLLLEVLGTPLGSKRVGSEACVLSVLVGAEADADYPLHSLFAVTRNAALSDPERREPVVLCAFGREGGVTVFDSLGALSVGIKTSLGSRDESILRRYVERPKRQGVREHTANQTLAVRYQTIEGNPVLLAFKRLLKSYGSLYKSLDGGARVFSETEDGPLSRLLLAVELEQHLNAPVSDALIQARVNLDLVRKAASAKKKLPTWLTESSVAQRKRFKHLLRHSLGSVLAFEEHLKQRLPALHTYARELLIARLREDDLYPQLDIDTPFIEMPDHVDSQVCGWESSCTVGDRKEVLTPSAERSRFSLLQLALHNLDPQMMPTWWRFRYAQYLKPAWKQQLSADYLINMVFSLDIGGRYAALIDRVFYSPGTDTRVPQLLRRVLLAGADADLYSAVRRGFTLDAQRFFNTAMKARVPQDLLAHGDQLQLCIVHLVGHTLQHDRYFAGILVIHDRLSQRCVVYWPAAPDAMSLSEHANLQAAQEYLNRHWASPDNVTALARHIAPGWAFEAINPHPGQTHGALFDPADLRPDRALLKGLWHGAEFVRSFSVKHLVPTALVEDIEKQILEQVASDPLHWLVLVPTSHSDARALLYRARATDLHHQAQAGSRSSKSLEKYREQRLEAEADSRARALLSIVSPFFGLGNQLYELLLTARHYHRTRDPLVAVDVAFGTVLLAIDLLLFFLPGPKAKPGAMVRPKVPSIGAGLGRIHRSTLAQFGWPLNVPQSSSAVTRLKPLERFRTPGRPQNAVGLQGPGEKGLYVRRGEHFLGDETHHYPIYRREGEDFFRLKNHDAPGADELILTIYSPKEWLLGADAPVAGPSSGVLSPWRAPDQSPSWRPPSVRIATHNRIRQSSAPADHWFSWRTPAPDAQSLNSSASGVFHVPVEPPGFAYDVIYVGRRYDTPTQSGAGYYRVLHQGEHAPLSDIVFIGKHEPLVSKVSVDIERWTTTALGEQPLPATRTATGEWQLHSPLFTGPPESEVGRAFPGLTSKSRKFAVARVLELSDSSRSATASHLLNLRATLDDWLTLNPLRPGQTDDLLRMLRPLQRKPTSVFIGYEGKTPGFTRVDFRPSVALDARLRSGGMSLAVERKTAQRAAVRSVLEQQGFSLHEWQIRRGHVQMHELVATHPRSNQVYYMTYQWLERGSVQLNMRLTDSWLNTAINAYRDSVLAATVRSAMVEQRLVPIVTGIQWPSLGNLPPTVYFVRVTPL